MSNNNSYKDALEHPIFNYISQAADTLKLETYVIGGFVRDYFLKRGTHKDIDIVVDNVSGLQFAQTIDKYRVQQGEATAKIGVIQANPEQSKHLETATMNLLGMPIDFVNLRKEAYSDDSRIPAIVSS